MKRTGFFLGMLCLVPYLLSPAYAHEAHEHGAAKLNVAVDGEQVSIGLESPLANLLPFEHVPATPGQRRQVREMARRMHQAETLFHLTPSAECRLEKVTLASERFDAALLDPNIPPEAARAGGSKEPGGKGKKPAEEKHGDLDAEFVFVCAKPENLYSVEILLFSAWPRLQKMEAQAVTPKGQRAASLTCKKNVLSW